jgi:DNA (cytosine-5)-methyltransferase 1
MTDDETWVEGDHANTLNRFDVGDTRTTHIVVNALDRQQGGADDNSAQAGHLVAETITAAFMAGQGSRAGGIGYEEEISPTLKAASSGTNQAPTMLQQMSVRRLTPVECERLMGLPDGWTAPSGVKAPDSKRYAACGDAIVTTVAFWIADRIRMIEEEEEA